MLCFRSKLKYYNEKMNAITVDYTVTLKIFLETKHLTLYFIFVLLRQVGIKYV